MHNFELAVVQTAFFFFIDIILLGVIFLIILNIRNRVKQKENPDSSKSNQKLDDRLSIIQSLSKVYFASFYIDLTNNSFNKLNSNDVITDVLGTSGNAQEALYHICDGLVHYQTADALRKFVDLKTVDDRMREKEVITCEYIDKKTGWSQLYFIACDRDKNGRLKTLLVTIRNIDEEKMYEQKIQRREKLQLETISNAIHGGFKTGKNDKNFTFNYVSTQFAQMLGYTVEELLEVSGGTMAGIVNKDDIVNELPKAAESIKKGEMYTMNYRIRCKDGSWKNVEDRGRLIHNSDGEDEFWCFIIDKDELTGKTKALELAETANQALIESQNAMERARLAAEAASAAKTSFLFNMSHDIRTPMNAIIGFTNLLEKNQEDPVKRAGYIKKIEDSSNVLLSIINNVLEMARIEKGAVEIDEQVWSAEQFNDTLYSVFHEMMEEKGIEYTCSIDVQHNYVFCDSLKLKEIFINILSNAYKYTNPGGKVHMEVKELPCGREGYVVYQATVSDTGIGMSPEFLPHIFKEFTRENNTTDNKIEGTGLGMPIVRRLLDIMGGMIEVESEKGKGSSFIVTLPLKLAEKSMVEDRSGINVDSELFRGKRILLTEDNELNAEIAMEILTEVGFEVERAEDGLDCLEMIEKASADYYDVVLMDIQMPNMNGYDTTRSIRGLSDTAKSGIPIVAMTANAFEEDKREARRCGMNEHISKPIDINELFRILTKVFAH